MSCAIIEKKDLGGTCVNVGCVPKKVMWNAAQISDAINKYGLDHGFEIVSKNFSWSTLIKNRRSYVERIRKSYESVFKKNSVDVFRGTGRFVGDKTIEVNGQLITANHILISTGGRPIESSIQGAEYGINSDGFFELTELPARTAIIGSGYIAIEIAGVLNALGSETHLFVRKDRPLRTFDTMLTDALVGIMEKEGPSLHTKSIPKLITKNFDGSLTLELENGDKKNVDCLIWAIGREPEVESLNLKATGVRIDQKGNISVDKYQNTSYPGIYAVGDNTGAIALTPTAIAGGRGLADRLFNKSCSDNYLDYENVPTVVFSHPPIASIGITESEACAKYGSEETKVYTSSFVNTYTAIGNNRQMCKMKLVCLGKSEKIIGIHGIGHGLDEILQGFSVALRMGATKKDFDNTIAIHPTASEEFVTMS
jgi:glutathione reductase (NADPH)